MLAKHDAVSRAAQDQVSWQLAVGARFGETMVRGMRQMADLNLGMLRATLEQNNLAMRQLCAASDLCRLLSLATAQVHPGTLRHLDYGCCLATILAGMQGDMLRACAVVPDTEAFVPRLPGRAGLSIVKGVSDSVFRFPADLARAVRLALNLNAPVWESGKLRIAYAAPGRAAG